MATLQENEVEQNIFLKDGTTFMSDTSKKVVLKFAKLIGVVLKRTDQNLSLLVITYHGSSSCTVSTVPTKAAKSCQDTLVKHLRAVLGSALPNQAAKVLSLMMELGLVN